MNRTREIQAHAPGRMAVVVLVLFCLALAMSALAQNEAGRVSLTSPDFSKYEKKFPWKVAPTLIEDRSAKNPGINFAEANVKPYSLPDILTLADGKKVTTAKVWEQQRRGELLDLFRSEVYGVAPPKPGDLAFRVVETNPQAMDGKATLKRIAIAFKLAGEQFTFHLTLFVPNRRAGKAPVFLLLNHRGPENTDSTRQTRTEFWPAEYVIGRGYAIAGINTSAEVDPDQGDALTGIRQFYRKHYAKPETLTWATISAWAWAASRAADYFETDPDINPSEIAVIGHSRSGKSALWAGAQDTRFAFVCPSGSGNSGTKLSKRNLGEDVATINTRFPHWFTAKYKTYNGKEGLLPVDQHQVVALVAPRGYHDSQGAEDLWADPRGAWLSFVEASKVWALSGKAVVMKDEMPLVNSPLLNGPIGYHIHDGGHSLGLFDWKLCLDHADTLFKK